MKSKQRDRFILFFRVDGNSEIATGHLMRCLTIARAALSYKEYGNKENVLEIIPIFLLGNEESERLLHSFIDNEEKEKISTIVIDGGDYKNPESELENMHKCMENCLKKYFPSCTCEGKVIAQKTIYPDDYADPNPKEFASCPAALLIDSYYAKYEYLKKLSTWIKTAYIDDLNEFDYPVDLIINYDPVPPAYPAIQGRKVLIGLEYSPIKTAFTQKVYRLREKVKDILFTTGGGDREHLALKFVELLRSDGHFNNEIYKGIRYHILSGPLSEDGEKLEKLTADNPDIIIHKNLKDPSDLFLSCDMAICAAGTTLYELSAVGVPVLSYTFADNQLPGALGFKENGIIEYIGDARDGDIFWKNLAEAMTRCISSAYLRKTVSEKQTGAVDGKGANRIVEGLISL